MPGAERDAVSQHSAFNIQHSLYPIVDATVCAARGIDPVDLARAVIGAGARLLQVRAKDLPDADFLALLDRAVRISRPQGARVVVNDRADLALMAGADGVHVGQEDLSVEQVRSVVGGSSIVGVSTHDRAQIDAALGGDASYVAVGPVFATATKETGYEPRGLDLVRYAAGRGKPIVAIGGITLERVPDVLAAGAWGLAVITDLLRTGDPEGRARDYLRACAA